MHLPLCFLALVLTCNALEDDLDKLYFPREKECSGMCIMKTECPEGKLSKTESCPASKNEGAVCCHSEPKSETRCKKFGGDCTQDRCPSFLIRSQALDCPNDTKCCVRTY